MLVEMKKYKGTSVLVRCLYPVQIPFILVLHATLESRVLAEAQRTEIALHSTGRGFMIRSRGR